MFCCITLLQTVKQLFTLYGIKRFVHVFQLVDFRTVVSQMLGLNTTALVRPNYEIIKLLETLLHSHHHHHLHHHVNMPWHCPTHQSVHLPQIQDPPDCSLLDVSTLRSACREDVVPL